MQSLYIVQKPSALLKEPSLHAIGNRGKDLNLELLSKYWKLLRGARHVQQRESVELPVFQPGCARLGNLFHRGWPQHAFVNSQEDLGTAEF